jgi:glutamate-1-semialdehyde 2,1-aminomutase
MTAGQDLWKRAMSVIPGGNGLLSKRPDRYAPDIWPCYFKRCSGVEVLDLDGRVFIDMAQMGLGSSILGYAHPELTEAVCATASDGVNCTLNSPEEVLLAERLLELNPFAGGVRFARTGGEAMAIAVRIARAYTGRAKVAFSGYHGWCDWYLATNLSSSNALSDHLLPGLEPKGVPEGLRNSAVPFLYNDVADFERVITEHPDIGVICVEGARYDFPQQDFLNAITAKAKERGIVIVSDEITSGWRMTNGGVFKLNGFEPHIVVYAKAMGGGYAIAAVVGRAEVMDAAQETFMSSTMWTERVGFTAALTTINVLAREKAWEQFIRIGTRIGEGWHSLAKRHGLNLKVTDFKPLITMKLEYGDRNAALQTLFTQEMLDRGYLAASSVYVSLAHTDEVVDRYLDAADEAFMVLADAANKGDEMKRLRTKPKSDAFQRLTK